MLKDWTKRLLPQQVRRPLVRVYGRQRQQRRPPSYLDKPFDWSRTRAFPHGHYGNIYINLKGRETCGIVGPGEEYERVRESICQGLEAWTNPLTGKPAVKRAWRKEELYHGHRMDCAPDIIVEWADYAYVGSRATNYRAPMVHNVHCFYHHLVQSGSHRPEGVLLLKGPGVRTNYVAPPVDLQDIAPTVLHIGGLPVPSYVDGRVLVELFEDHFVELRVPQVIEMELASDQTEAEEDFTPEESEEVLERLKSLGYLE